MIDSTLSQRRPPLRHIKLKTCDSTQMHLKELTAQMSPFEPTVVSAHAQEHGIGRRGKPWVKCDNSIAFSVLFPFQHSPTLASLKLGNDVCQFIKEKYEIPVSLKWPNDIFLNGKKIGGIIAQLIQGPHNQQWVLAGIGLNLGQPSPTQLKELAQFQATFLSESIVLREEDEHQIALELAELITKNEEPTESLILTKWKENCFHMGKQVIILENDQVVMEGTFSNVGNAGQAFIKTIDRMEEIWSGNLRVRNFC